MNLIYGSVCSGIEAASVAWHPLGWHAAWLAEIEPFPARVLHHHYGSGQPVHMPDPDADGIDEETVTARRANLKAVSVLPTIISPSAPRNLGDMTKIASMVRAGAVAAPDVLVGGTPCQAFSIAGLRASLGDARGQLSLSFVDLANAIDTARYVRGEPAAVVLWENVPGVLSTADNAFGCFLGALAGEDFPLEPAGGKWSNAGCVYGPQRTVAWRVLDAQYFGVAQRRRRVFVIASARKGFDPTEVLFEFDGVRRDIAPSREAGEDVATAPAGSVDGGRDAGSDQDSGVICMAHGQGGAEIARERGATLTCNYEAPIVAGMVASVDVCPTLRAGGNRTGGDRPPGTDVDTADSLLFGIPIAFSSKDYGGDAMLDCSPTLSAGGHVGSHANAGNPPAIAFDSRQDCVSRTFMASDYKNGTFEECDTARPLTTSADRTRAAPVCITGEITHTLKAEGFDASEDRTGRGNPIVTAFQESQSGVRIVETHATLGANDGPRRMNGALVGMAVRRLTPRECERLQAFPDFHTLIPMSIVKPARAETMQVNGDPVALIDGQWWKMSADGPRYKALGNSMCTKNMAWLGRRIEMALAYL